MPGLGATRPAGPPGRPRPARLPRCPAHDPAHLTAVIGQLPHLRSGVAVGGFLPPPPGRGVFAPPPPPPPPPAGGGPGGSPRGVFLPPPHPPPPPGPPPPPR